MAEKKKKARAIKKGKKYRTARVALSTVMWNLLSCFHTIFRPAYITLFDKSFPQKR